MVSEFGGERRAVVARELTKTHETIYRGKLSELVRLSANDANFQRGEITLVVSGAEEVASTVDSQMLKRAVELLAKELPPGKGGVDCGAIDGCFAQRGVRADSEGRGQVRADEQLTSGGRH